MRSGRMFAAVAILAIVASACGGATIGSAPPSSPSGSTTPASSAPPRLIGHFDVGGYSLFLSCEGAGSPTVVFENGLNGAGAYWAQVEPGVAETTRTCIYDRAGLGASDPRPAGVVPKGGLTPGLAAADEKKLLAAAGVTGPLVLVAHSFGGMIARMSVAQNTANIAGVVLVDSSSPRQYDPAWEAEFPDTWTEGGNPIDRAASRAELDGVTTFGAIPLIVLTEGQMSGDFERKWALFQDQLATLSSNSLHMVADKSTHSIMNDQHELTIATIQAMVEAVRASGPLPTCADQFASLGAGCLVTTMTDQLKGWDADRAAITPTSGTFPDGTYREVLTGAQFLAATGRTADFSKATVTWDFKAGHWSVNLVIDTTPPETHAGTFADSAGTLSIVIPEDWIEPRTSGIYSLQWSADPDGTVHFRQVDTWPIEALWTQPFVPTAG